MIEKYIKQLLIIKDYWRFSMKDKIFFLRELSYLIGWWISIVESITIIRSTTDNYTLKDICNKIYESLKKWEPLYRALSRLRKYFNEWDVNIIRSWENSGELLNVLKYLSDEYEFLYDVRSKYIWAMIYPTLIFIVAIIAVFVIFKYILPWIIWVLTEFEWATLPWTTHMLIFITNFVGKHSFDIFVFLVIFFVIFGIVIATDEWKKYFDKFKLTIPIFGKITKTYHLIKYLRYQKLLIYSGMPYVDVFRLLRDVVTHTTYKDMIDDVIIAVRKWEKMVDVLYEYPSIIPRDVVALLKVWEESAALGKSIDNAVRLYTQEFEKTLNNLSKIIEPILVIFVWIIVWFVSISVFSVIWSIMDSLQV